MNKERKIEFGKGTEDRDGEQKYRIGGVGLEVKKEQGKTHGCIIGFFCF